MYGIFTFTFTIKNQPIHVGKNIQSSCQGGYHFRGKKLRLHHATHHRTTQLRLLLLAQAHGWRHSAKTGLGRRCSWDFHGIGGWTVNRTKSLHRDWDAPKFVGVVSSRSNTIFLGNFLSGAGFFSINNPKIKDIFVLSEEMVSEM